MSKSVDPDEQNSSIKIASIQYFSRKYLMPTLRDLKFLNDARVYHVRSAKAIEAVLAGNVDLALVVSKTRPMRNPELCVEIKEEQIGVVGLRNNFRHIEKAVTLDDLKSEPWIIGDRVREDWCESLNEYKRAYYVEDHFSARALVLGVYGIAPSQLDYFTKQELQKLVISKVKLPSKCLKLYGLISRHSSVAVEERARRILEKVKYLV